MRFWDRQPNETTKAYAAFCLYRDLGKDRSIDKAYRYQNRSKTRAKRAPSWWMDWSRVHHWVQRAADWDAYQDALYQERYTKEIQEAKRRHVQMGIRLQLVCMRILEATDLDNITAEEARKLAHVAILAMKEGIKIELEALGTPSHAQKPIQDHRAKTEMTLAEALDILRDDK